MVVPRYGLDSVSRACEEALASRAASRDVILNLLSRHHDESPPVLADPPRAPALQIEPLADCRRYDRLLAGGAHAA